MYILGKERFLICIATKIKNRKKHVQIVPNAIITITPDVAATGITQDLFFSPLEVFCLEPSDPGASKLHEI